MSKRKQNMQRDYNIYLTDILNSIEKIQGYMQNISYEEFKKNSLLTDAIVRNLEIIGEAVKQIPLEIKKENPSLEWKKIAGFRDILIHSYFTIDLEIVWDIVKNKLPALREAVEVMLQEKK